MMKSIGAAMLTLTLMFAGSVAIGAAAIDAASAASQVVPKPHAREASDVGKRHRARRVPRYAYRAVDPPAYYDRPNYYRSYPYVLPVPFFLGLGFGPWW
jgi:hypothetical protein